MNGLKLKILNDEYAMHQLPPDGKIPEDVFKADFYSITRTDDELSIIAEARISIKSNKVETDYSCMKLIGEFEVLTTGIWASITTILADAGISVLAVTTYNTDYFLVKTAHLDKAVAAFKKNGYLFD